MDSANEGSDAPHEVETQRRTVHRQRPRDEVQNQAVLVVSAMNTWDVDAALAQGANEGDGAFGRSQPRLANRRSHPDHALRCVTALKGLLTLELSRHTSTLRRAIRDGDTVSHPSACGDDRCPRPKVACGLVAASSRHTFCCARLGRTSLRRSSLSTAPSSICAGSPISEGSPRSI